LAHAKRSESYQGNHKYLGPKSLSVAYSVNQLVHREAITHAQLDHPNIIPFLGVYRENTDGPPMTVLPFIERGSLGDVIDEEAVHGVEFVWIVRSIAHDCE
jgi:serine/threonine protein kinase